MRGAIVTFIYLVLAPIEMHLRRRRYPPPRPPVTGPKTFVTGPPADPLTIEDVHAPAAPTWGAQRGAC